MMRGMRASLRVPSVVLALLSAPATSALPPVEPPARGVAIVFEPGAPPARCRVEVERVPTATFALGVAAIAREQGLAGEVRGAGVELAGGRPALVVRLAPPDAAAQGAPDPERFCAWARDLAAGLARDALDASGADGTPRWLIALDPGTVRFRSVQRMTRAGETLGFAEYAIGARADGTRVLLSRGAFLQRRDGAWTASDAAQVEDADARGMLVSGRYARFQGGALLYRVDLRRDGEHGFAYSGEARGRAIGGRIDAPDGLATTLVRIDLFGARTGPPAEPVRVETYDPLADPLRATPVVHRRDPARPGGIVTQAGGRTGTGAVEPDGTLAWIETAGEPPTRIETVWREGAP